MPTHSSGSVASISPQQVEVLVQQLLRAVGDDELRTAALKLSSCVQASGAVASRSLCDLMLTSGNQVAQRYIITMKGISDTSTLVHMTAILTETLKDKERCGAVCRRLSELGGAEVMVASLRVVGSTSQQHATAAALYAIIYKMGRKDERLAVRFRLCGGLRVLLRSLQEAASRARVSAPLLQVLKLVADNDQNAAVLGRGECVEQLCRLVPHLWNMSGVKQQLAVECLARLCRHKSNRRRLTREPVLARLLALLQPRQQQLEKKTLYNLQRAVLGVVFTLAELKSGREMLLEAHVLDAMQTFLRRCPSPEHHDRLFCRAANTALRCVAKWTLPVARLESPVKFAAPAAPAACAQAGDGPARAEQDSGTDSEADTEADTEPDAQADGTLVRQHTVAVPEPVRTPAAELLRCAMLFSELSSAQLSAQPSSARRSAVGAASPPPPPPPPAEGSAEGRVSSPLARDAGCQCLPRCLSRLCRQRAAGGSPLGPAPAPAAGSGAQPVAAGRPALDWRARSQQTGTEESHRLLTSPAPPAPPPYSQLYRRLARQTRRVAPFVKLAYPDLVGAEAVVHREPLASCDRLVCRRKVQSLVDSALGHNKQDSRVVYDYDLLVASFGKDDQRALDNSDERRVSSLVIDLDGGSCLRFESRFESGNLRRAIRTGPHEYDLVICPDVNSARHQQWFYFEVSNMRALEPYTFNLINNEKLSCEYQAGMRPVMFSVKEAMLGQPGWVRVGDDVFYYRNAYCRPQRHPGRRHHTAHSGRSSVYCTASLTVTFPHEGDVCYLAFHYPYTYTRLKTVLEQLCASAEAPDLWWRCEELAVDLAGNSCPLVTITAPGSTQHKKEVVFLTARIHPGETGASWAMEGALRFLLGASCEARALRSKFIFKLVPMLNVEGVVNGCHRCGLTDEDLNRRWKTPDPVLHPVIFRVKALMEYSTFILKRPPYLFCDFHGHSCRKNVFLYGCSNRRSWLPADRQKPDNEALVSCLPQALYRVFPAFSLRSCQLTVERGREATARVVVWRELGVQRSYTMETTYSGCDQGPYQNSAICTRQLREAGARLCVALHLVSSPGDLAALEMARSTYWWRPQAEFVREFQLSSAENNTDATESGDSDATSV